MSLGDEFDNREAFAALDDGQETARVNGCALGFLFAPLPKDQRGDDFSVFGVFVDVANGDGVVTLRVYDPETGHQLHGLMLRDDDWQYLVDNVNEEEAPS